METNKLIAGIVAAAIAIIVLAGVLMPALGNATATTDTFTNEGYFNVIKLDEESEYKLFWDHTNPYQVTINDTDVITFADMGLLSYQAISLISSDEFSFRFLNVSDNPRIQVYGNATWGFGGSSYTSGIDITATLSNGTLTIENTADTDPYSQSHDMPANMYGIALNGDYVMKKITQDAYVLDDSEVILCGITESGGNIAGVYADGNITDGLTYKLFRPSAQSETAVFSNEVITSVADADYVGLNKLSKIQFSVTLTGGTLDATYTYFIVPAEVTAEKAVHLSDAMNVILNVIPLLIIVAVLLGVVAVFILRRE